MSIIRVVLLASLCIGAAQAQSTISASTAPTTSPAAEGRATVYIYRVDVTGLFWPFRSTLPIYFGRGGVGEDKQRNIADLREKRYFMMSLEPGSYTFDTRGMPDKLWLELKGGDEYYLRVDEGHGCERRPYDPDAKFDCNGVTPASIKRMEPEKARAEMREAKPINKGQAKDRNLVIIPNRSVTN
jgi:hypothetical protein